MATSTHGSLKAVGHKRKTNLAETFHCESYIGRLLHLYILLIFSQYLYTLSFPENSTKHNFSLFSASVPMLSQRQNLAKHSKLMRTRIDQSRSSHEHQGFNSKRCSEKSVLGPREVQCPRHDTMRQKPSKKNTHTHTHTHTRKNTHKFVPLSQQVRDLRGPTNSRRESPLRRCGHTTQKETDTPQHRTGGT